MVFLVPTEAPRLAGAGRGGSMIAEKEPRKTRRGGNAAPPRPVSPDVPRPASRPTTATPGLAHPQTLGAVETVRLRESPGPMAHRGPKTLRRAQQFAWR